MILNNYFSYNLDVNDDTTLRFLVGTTDDGETVYGDFKKSGHFISSGHVGSGHASYDEAAFASLQTYYKTTHLMNCSSS